ncbi:MAG: M20/M25/M40 family metallo-hydrolase, partial [Gemmatimonadaceae bacterium]
ARQVANQMRERISLGVGSSGGPPLVAVHARSVAALLGESGVDISALRSERALIVRDLPDLQVTVSVRDERGSSPSAPNVVGILEGSDPVLRNEYVVFSAHMDHVGTNGAAKGDTIWNGADDDASGTIGVVELAESFAHLPIRPKRSMIFLTVSGEEKGLWGSEYFTSNMPVPTKQVVADLNIDMIGRNWKDTIVAIGKEHSDLGATLDRVNREHPELGMHAIDDIWPTENFYSRSDHFNFARRGIPVLFFFNGTHADYHQPSDSPDKIDAEKEARILRLIYYLGTAISDAAERPKWKQESYDRIVQ